MLTKTKGIVFNHIKYKETSIITKIFTRELGVQSYIVNSVRSKGKTNKISFYQPLTLLDLVVYANPKSELHRISEAQFLHKYQSIPFDVYKSAINLFLAEVLGKTMIEQEENVALFDFLESAFKDFDHAKDGFSEFHLFVLIHLMDFLGHSIQEEPGELNLRLMEIKKNGYCEEVNGKIRTEMLHFLINHYKEHSQMSLNLKSLPVLEAVFS